MAKRSEWYIWGMRGVYVGLCLVIVFLHLLPLDTIPRGWAGPDLMVAMTFAWVLRRPEYTPVILIAAVFLLADFLLQRPPGLWAVLVLIGSQTLRSRAPDLRYLTFLMEWISVVTTVVTVTLGYRIILGILLVDQAPLGLALMGMISTLLVYPLVVFATQTVFRVRKITPHEHDALRAG